MSHRISESANYPSRDRLRSTESSRSREREATWRDPCTQCGFLWGLHPERYDDEEKASVRFCSEYPASAPWAIQSCIRP